MIGGLRNFTAKEDREAGTELRLVAPSTLARCRLRLRVHHRLLF